MTYVYFLSFIPVWVFISCNYRSWYTQIELWKTKLELKKLKEGKNIKIYTEKDVFETLYKKRPWYEETYNFLYYRVWIKFWDLPKDFFDEISHAWQRYRRGWSYRDIWSVDNFLSNIIPEMLKELKRAKSGVPLSVFNKSDKKDESGDYTDKTYDLVFERWGKILDQIILTFEISKMIESHNWICQESKNYNVKDANMYRRFQKILKEKNPDLYDDLDNHVMTKEECKVYEKGWDLFKKYYFSLWS